MTVDRSLMIDSPVKIKRMAARQRRAVESVAIGSQEVLINRKVHLARLRWSSGWNDQARHLRPRRAGEPGTLTAVREQVARRRAGRQRWTSPLDNDTAFVRGRVKDLFRRPRDGDRFHAGQDRQSGARVDVPPRRAPDPLHVKFATVDRSVSSELGLELASTAFNQSTAVGTGSPISQTGGAPFSLSQAVNPLPLPQATSTWQPPSTPLEVKKHRNCWPNPT